MTTQRAIGMIIVIAMFAIIATGLMQTADYTDHPHHTPVLSRPGFCADGQGCGHKFSDVTMYTTRDGTVCVRTQEQGVNGMECHHHDER